jgi:hypothetical protein
LVESFVGSNTIAFYEFAAKLLNVFRNLISEKSFLIPGVEIDLVLVEIVGNVVNGVVVGRIFIINEDEFVVGVLNDNVVGE